VRRNRQAPPLALRPLGAIIIPPVQASAPPSGDPKAPAAIGSESFGSIRKQKRRTGATKPTARRNPAPEIAGKSAMSYVEWVGGNGQWSDRTWEDYDGNRVTPKANDDVYFYGKQGNYKIASSSNVTVGSLSIDPYVDYYAKNTLDITGGVFAVKGETFNDGNIRVERGADLKLQGHVDNYNSGTIVASSGGKIEFLGNKVDNSGYIYADNYGNIDVGSRATIANTNSGWLMAINGSTISLDQSATIKGGNVYIGNGSHLYATANDRIESGVINEGHIGVVQGKLTITGAVTGVGQATGDSSLPAPSPKKWISPNTILVR
jgi:hypothetical protein